MTQNKLYDPSKGKMRVAGFMSGSGTNLVKLLEHQRSHPNSYEVVMLFTDKPNNEYAPAIAEKFEIPLHSFSAVEFSKQLGIERNTDGFRILYDQRVADIISPFDIDTIALGGYMRILSSRVLPLRYTVFNVHPADLSIVDGAGKRKYVGANAVQLAMDAGETHLRATTHLITAEDRGVDSGPILLRSAPMEVDYALSADENQKRLKVAGDWKIFPLTAELIAEGAFTRGTRGNIYYGGWSVPDGLTMEELLCDKD